MLSAFRKRPIAFLALALLSGCVALVVVLGVWKAMMDGSNRIEDWLPTGIQETRDLQWFRNHFGSDSFLMVSWEGCEISPPRSAETLPSPSTGNLPDSEVNLFADCLRRVSLAPGQPAIFSQVITGNDAVELLVGSSIGIDREEAVRRLRGWMIGPDGHATCVVAILSETGAANDRLALDAVYQTAHRCLGSRWNTDEQLHVAGPAVEALEIERASHLFLLPLNLACYFVCTILMLLTLRNWKMTAIVLSTAITSQLLLLATIGYSPWCRLDSIMLIAPSFMFVLTVSGAVHVVNYYRDAVISKGRSSAVRSTLQSAAAPTLLASMTTCIGLLTLSQSVLEPVRNFGIYSAIGVLQSLGLLAILPWLLHACSVIDQHDSQRGHQVSNQERSRRLSEYVNRNHGWILAAATLFMAVGMIGVNQIQAKIRIHDFFLPESRLIRDYRWLQQKIGPLGPIEVVARIPKSSGLTLLDQLELVERIEQNVKTVPGIVATASGATFSPPPASLKSRSLRGVARKTLIAQRLDRLEATLNDLGFLRTLPDEWLWRVSARAVSDDAVDYGPICLVLQSAASTMKENLEREGISGAAFVITGGVPVLQKAQDQMLEDLIQSFLFALLLITLCNIMLFIVWSFMDQSGWTSWTSAIQVIFLRCVAGLLSMIPNVLPVIVVFGTIGALGVEVGVGSMLTASVALGIAVDDTLHFLTWYRRAAATGRSRQESVASALTHCSKAMMQTTAIFVFGLAVFTLSPSLPTARYAAIMCSMLTIALLDDLIVLPAILLSKLGRVFGWEVRSHESGGISQPENDP